MTEVDRVLVLGAGRSGQAARELAASQGLSVRTLEGNEAFPGGEAFAFAVVSPGVPLTHPWQEACRTRGVPVRSELQFGCEALARRGVRMLAVTGSKGKSSVVKLVADALARAGQAAVPCGNYGTPVCAVARQPRVDWAVVEVSSFQLETTGLPADAFVSAAVLNLQEDHLDRHGSVAAYHALKRRLLAFTRAPAEPAADAASVLAGSYFDNPVLRANGAYAVSLLRTAGLADADIRRAALGFVPLPHRMQVVGTWGGVRCIDDSKATSLAALAAGVGMCAPAGVRLVAGGLAKGDDPRGVREPLTKGVRKVYLIGSCAEAFAAAWQDAVVCEVCGTLERAVARALGEASAGEVVLLSPGAASFDQFSSFGQRGDVFAELAKKEGQKRT